MVGSILGAVFGALVWHQRPGAGETFFWGLVYGVFWWYLGPLTLTPLVEGDNLSWDVSSAQAGFPLLVGHVLYGAATGLALVLFQWRGYLADRPVRIDVGALLRGGLAGLQSAGLLGVMLNVQDQLLTMSAMVDSESSFTAWGITVVIGLIAGLAFALLYPRGADVGLVRGMTYSEGFSPWAGQRPSKPAFPHPYKLRW